MNIDIGAEKLPLATDEDGVIRIGNTRVTLDTVVAAFQEGTTPEGIAYQYPVLALADIYAVVAYYLRHRSNVDRYLQQRQRVAAEIKQENERRFEPEGVRDRLMTRRREKANSSA